MRFFTRFGLLFLFLFVSNVAFCNEATSIIINNEEDFFSKVSVPNTTYVVTTDIDLYGRTIIIPENVTLIFKCEWIKSGTIQLQSGSQLLGNNVVFYTHPHKQMVLVKDAEGVIIDNIDFRTVGNAHSSYESGGVHVKNSSNVTIRNCKFSGASDGSSGFVGLSTLKVDRLYVNNNVFNNFYKPGFWESKQKNTAWATYFVSVSNAEIYRNTFDKTYSGIKLTGFIEDVNIHHNVVKNSITDGCDFAGISARNVRIEKNEFTNCGDCGVEFKILFQDAMHIGEMEKYYGYSLNAPRFFQNISICDNIIESWVGLKIWNQYNNSRFMSEQLRYFGYNRNSGGIALANNKLKKTASGSGNPNTDVGIQIAYNAFGRNDFVVTNNDIQNYKIGVYFVNSSNVSIRYNTINSIGDSFYERFEEHRDLMQKYNFGIEIDGNTIISQKGLALNLSTRTKDFRIVGNTISCKRSIENHGQNNIIESNNFKK